jgi:PIN domain nuclease of toxin-antitoxin system
MQFLIDSHAFLWFSEGSPRLSARAFTLIDDKANQPGLSIASLWEIAIKVGLGKLQLRQPFPVFIPEQMREHGIAYLPVELAHIATVAALPHYHRDPFDRMMIAQALVRQLPIVSADTIFDAYGVTRLW